MLEDKLQAIKQLEIDLELEPGSITQLAYDELTNGSGNDYLVDSTPAQPAMFAKDDAALLNVHVEQQYITANDYYVNNIKRIDARYRTFQDRGPLGIMLHSVGCPQPDPYVFVKTWNKPKLDVAVHAVMDGSRVIQCMPWNYRAVHCAGAANNTHIGVEMTEPNFISYIHGADWKVKSGYTLADVQEYAIGTYQLAVKLFANLCITYHLNPLADGVIISHFEGYVSGVASGHSDVEHIWNLVGLSMVQFRKDVSVAMTEPTPITDQPSSWAQAAWEWAKQTGYKDENGNFVPITDGTNPKEPCTREQIITMLYRYSKSSK